MTHMNTVSGSPIPVVAHSPGNETTRTPMKDTDAAVTGKEHSSTTGGPPTAYGVSNAHNGVSRGVGDIPPLTTISSARSRSTCTFSVHHSSLRPGCNGTRRVTGTSTITGSTAIPAHHKTGPRKRRRRTHEPRPYAISYKLQLTNSSIDHSQLSSLDSHALQARLAGQNS